MTTTKLQERVVAFECDDGTWVYSEPLREDDATRLQDLLAHNRPPILAHLLPPGEHIARRVRTALLAADRADKWHMLDTEPREVLGRSVWLVRLSEPLVCPVEDEDGDEWIFEPVEQPGSAGQEPGAREGAREGVSGFLTKAGTAAPLAPGPFCPACQATEADERPQWMVIVEWVIHACCAGVSRVLESFVAPEACRGDGDTVKA